jgi:D,D-heptose 1,7-bisphosphate phosphatase
LGTIIVHPNDHPHDSDLVACDAQHQVKAIHPKPHQAGTVLANNVNAAVYIFSPAVFTYLNPHAPADIAKDTLPAILQDKQILMAYSTPEYIKDMGTGDRYAQTNLDFISGAVARKHLGNPRPAVFLDRDGVINPDLKDHEQSPQFFKLLPGVASAIRTLNKAGYLVIVVTNQPAIAKGFLSSSTLDQIHATMEWQLGESHAYLDRIFYCPHHPDAGFEGEIPHLKIDCTCRKPKPGMIHQAMADFNIDLSRSFLVGDHPRDIQAGKAAGLMTVLVGETAPETYPADYRFPSLAHAIERLCKEGS